jgi:hypothetical protein
MRSDREWPAHRSVRCQGRLEARQFVLDVAHQDQPRCAAVPNDRVDHLGNSLALARATGFGGSNRLPRSGNADSRKSNIVLDPDMQTTSLPPLTNSSMGVLCCIGVFVVGFSDSTSIWPPSSREGFVMDVVGYALRGQGDAHPPCPRGCRGGIEESESGVPLWRQLRASTLSQESRTETERPEGPLPSKPLHRTIPPLSRHCHPRGTAPVRCLRVPRLASPPSSVPLCCQNWRLKGPQPSPDTW